MAEATADRRRLRLREQPSRRRATTTPGRLRTFSSWIGVTTIVLAIIGCGGLGAAAVNVTGIQQTTVPAIIGMEHIHAWLSDADRNAANAYLAGGSLNAPSQLQFDANIAGTSLDVLGRLNPGDPQLRYEADIAAASSQLQKTIEQNVGGSGASQGLQAIGAAVGNYTRLVQTASINEGEDPVAGTVYLQAASNLMHGQGGILAQVDGMRDFYRSGLDQANLNLEITGAIVAPFVVAAIVVLVLLVRTQRFVRARFRRRRNNRLLAATLLLVIVSVGTCAGAAQAAQVINTDESQSYVRLLNLWKVRVLAYDAQANESLSLVAGAAGAQFDQQFRLDTTSLVDRPLTDQEVQDAARGQVAFKGLLADELRGAASPAERGAALRVLSAYRAFLVADAAVRANPPPAGGRGTPTQASMAARDQLSTAFAEFDWYLGVSVQVLQSDFDGSMGMAGLTLVLTTGLVLLSLAIVALTFWGLQPRLSEYTAGSKPT